MVNIPKCKWCKRTVERMYVCALYGSFPHCGFGKSVAAWKMKQNVAIFCYSVRFTMHNFSCDNNVFLCICLVFKKQLRFILRLIHAFALIYLTLYDVSLACLFTHSLSLSIATFPPTLFPASAILIVRLTGRSVCFGRSFVCTFVHAFIQN